MKDEGERMNDRSATLLSFILNPSALFWSGHWDSNPEPCADLALTPLIRRLLYHLSYAPSKLIAVEGVEPTSLDYQSSALAVELHREKLVDPAGLKPAPHGLKGRRSVTRAPGQ